MSKHYNSAGKYVLVRQTPDGVASAALLNRDARSRNEPEFECIYTTPRTLANELQGIAHATKVILADMILYDTRQFDIAKQVGRIAEESANSINAIRKMSTKTEFTIFSQYLHARDIAAQAGIEGYFNRSCGSAEAIQNAMKQAPSDVYAAIASLTQGMNTPLAQRLAQPGQGTRQAVHFGSMRIAEAFYDGAKTTRDAFYAAVRDNYANVFDTNIIGASISGGIKLREDYKKIRVLKMREASNVLSVSLDAIDPIRRSRFVLNATPEKLGIKEPNPNHVIVFQSSYGKYSDLTTFFVKSFNTGIDAAVLTTNAVYELGGVGGGSINVGSGLVPTNALSAMKKKMSANIENSGTINDTPVTPQVSKDLSQKISL